MYMHFMNEFAHLRDFTLIPQLDWYEIIKMHETCTQRSQIMAHIAVIHT